MGYAAMQSADAQEMKEYGADTSSLHIFASNNKNKGKDVSHLQKSVLAKLAYLDEDDMFSPTKADDEYEAELERQLADAFKANGKGKGAAKLLKEAVGIDYQEEKGDMDLDDLEAAMEDTLDCGNMDIDDIGAQQQAMDEMNKDAIQLDFATMTAEDVA